MRVQSDFECGGAKRITRLGERHWRLETTGDSSGYTKYFCVRITPEPHEKGSIQRIDVYPDADLGEKGVRYFRSHFPSDLWCSRGGWDRWLPFRESAGNSVLFHGDWFEAHVAVGSETELYFATHPPFRYSDLVAWTKALEKKHGPRLKVCALGLSAEGRDIPVLYVPGKGRGRPRFLVLAGQHPSEHSGCRASQGIVEYLLSSLAEAREIADRFDFAVIPMMNPDGNVRGLSGANAEDIDLAEEFSGVAKRAALQATENRIFWQWLRTEFPPDLMLDLHSGHGCAAHTAPFYDGAALFVRDAEKLYADPRRVAAYRAIQDRFCFDIPACAAPGQGLGEKFVEYQAAAAFGTLPVLYHVNANMTGMQEQFRRGPQLLLAMANALLRDTDCSFFHA